jgi:hypothetical protein
MGQTPLDYYQRTPRGPDSNIRIAALLSVCSLACVGVPIVGWILQIGGLFIVGGLLAPPVGIIMAGVGMGMSRDMRGLCAVVLGCNALAVGYFVWLVFVRGLC